MRDKATTPPWQNTPRRTLPKARRASSFSPRGRSPHQSDLAEFAPNSATDGDHLLPQIGERIIALHTPLFDPEADLQGTLDGLWKVICEKIATQLDNRRDSGGEPYRTMSKNGFPRPDVSKVNGYFPPVTEPLNLRFHLIASGQHHGQKAGLRHGW